MLYWPRNNTNVSRGFSNSCNTITVDGEPACGRFNPLPCSFRALCNSTGSGMIIRFSSGERFGQLWHLDEGWTIPIVWSNAPLSNVVEVGE
jgi:hypothetical protein